MKARDRFANHQIRLRRLRTVAPNIKDRHHDQARQTLDGILPEDD